MLYQWWRKVEGSGGWSAFAEGIVIPNQISQTTYPRYGGIWYTRYNGLSSPKYRPKNV